MVSTRGHPTELPPPAITTTTPARSGRANETPNTSSSNSVAKRAKSPPSKSPPSKSPLSSSATSATSPTRGSGSTSSTRASSALWSHTPSNLTLVWLAVSLPLVIWDFGYVFLRPYSMPGGFLSWPLWTPYALYGKIDYIYGWPAWKAHNGFTAAQSAINVIETGMYLVYLYWVWRYGVQDSRKGRGAPSKRVVGWFGEARVLKGRIGAEAVILVSAASIMTLSKTALYLLNEYYSGFSHVGHNSFPTLFFMWIIPNGAWIVFPAYMVYIYGQEMLQGLEAAAEGRKRH